MVNGFVPYNVLLRVSESPTCCYILFKQKKIQLKNFFIFFLFTILFLVPHLQQIYIFIAEYQKLSEIAFRDRFNIELLLKHCTVTQTLTANDFLDYYPINVIRKMIINGGRLRQSYIYILLFRDLLIGLELKFIFRAFFTILFSILKQKNMLPLMISDSRNS